MSRYVPAVAPMSRRGIEFEAEQIIRQFFPEVLDEPKPFPVLQFFDHVLRENFDLDTGVDQLSDGVEGITWPDGRVFVNEETYRGAANGVGRARFTVVHEAYHGIKHRKQIQNALVDTGELILYRRSDIKPFLDPEWQANTFAAAILMPEKMVRQLSRRRNLLSLSMTLSQTFQVSTQAAEIRLKKLGV